MKPISFLDAVAQAYLSTGADLTGYCFVFPNKRSGTFFLKKLSENLGDRTILAPEILDIAGFMRRLAGRGEAGRIDALFHLYREYCRIAGRTPDLCAEDGLLDFDRFAPWGETILSDFNETEQYAADAEALFKNVRDYRTIASNFLTEKQQAVIERYFGYRPSAGDVEGFWKHFDDGTGTVTPLRAKFIELWGILPQLYQGLIASLEKEGLALQGTLFRLGCARAEEDPEGNVPWERVVFAGFNMLSTTEASLFETLRDTPCADGRAKGEFFWDAAGPVLGAGNGEGLAARAMERNMRGFPSPEWAEPFMRRSDVRGMPALTAVAAPSNAAQAKIASMTVRGWIDTVGAGRIRDARAAIVVPDENLLLPLLHSLPAELEAVNLTMGYSMRYTAVASFVHHLRRLLSRPRTSGGKPGYWHEDLRLLLAHPLVHAVAGTDVANRLNTEIAGRHLRVVTLEMLRAFSEPLAELLRPLDPEAGVEQAASYFDSVLATLEDALDGHDGELRTFDSKIERSQIALYRQALARLADAVRRHGIAMRPASVFHLADRLLGGEKVTFEGQPLVGLQVMGLLETRAIDFDNLVVLSMNDKIMPRRARRRTFIPDALRRGYGLPTAARAEELYSYYFYRMISRASSVTLIYDARAGEGMRSGGKSRYLMQLDKLYARGRMEEVKYSFRLADTESVVHQVEKTPVVMEQLSAFTRTENGRNLSASALMNYCQCQVKFYLRNVAQINDDPEQSEQIDAITQGNIVHDAMLRLYFPEGKRGRYLPPEERITLSRNDLEKMAADGPLLEQAVRRAVNKEHYKLEGKDSDRPLQGGVAVVAERLVSQVRDVVIHDSTVAPLVLVGGEMGGRMRWKAGDAPEVNIRYAFDRVDRTSGGKWRIVDYKTGGAHVEAKEWAEVFDGAYKAKYMLQLLLYARWLEDRVKAEGHGDTGAVGMEIYDVNTVRTEGGTVPVVGGMQLDEHSDAGEEFANEVERMMKEIFNTQIPFRPTSDPDNCTYCTLKTLCGREA